MNNFQICIKCGDEIWSIFQRSTQWVSSRTVLYTKYYVSAKYSLPFSRKKQRKMIYLCKKKICWLEDVFLSLTSINSAVLNIQRANTPLKLSFLIHISRSAMAFRSFYISFKTSFCSLKITQKIFYFYIFFFQKIKYFL